jgi:flagellar biosynthetic protein FliQ
MSLELALDLGREAFFMTLLLSAPILAVGLVVGLVVSLVQAVTQLQEQTLTFVPKIIAMAGAAVIFIPWMAVRMLEYTRDMLGSGL